MDPSANDNQWALPDPAAKPPATPTIPTPNLPADPAVDQWAAPNIAPLIRNNLATSFGSNADAEAVNRRAALATGVPLVTARNLPDQVQMQAAQQSFDAQLLARQFPTTAQLLTNPDNMRLAHDDIPGTVAVEQHVQALGNPQPQGPKDANGTVYPPGTQFLQPNPEPPSLHDRATAWLRELVGLPPAGPDEAAKARAFLDVTGKELGTDREGLRQAVGGMSTVPTQFSNSFFQSFTAGLAPDTQGPADTTAGGVASGAGTLAGFLLGAPLKIAEGVVERAAGPALNRVVGDSFVKGLTKDVTRQAATLGIASGLSSAGAALDQNTPMGAGQTALKAAESGAEMGATFGVAGRLFPDSTALQFAARALGTSAVLDAMNGQRPWDDRPLAQKVFDYGLNTVFSLNGAGRTGGGWLYDAARADAATQDANVLGGLSQASTVSKLRERDPDLFKQFVANAAQDGPVPAVYVDGTTLAEALHQSGIGTDEMQAKMPDLQPQLEEALTTGGQVRIPIEDYATHIAGGPLDAALLPHLRTDPEGMTQTEAQAFYQSHADQLKGEADQITAKNAADQPFIDSQKQVQDKVLEQLEATGRFRPEVNQAYAAMTRDFFTTMAERTGQLPHELFAQHPLNIDAESLGTGLEQPAYHGSPHDFDKFSSEHIGSGEGAQAYGHGLYFAENKDIAQGYRKRLSGGLMSGFEKDGQKITNTQMLAEYFKPGRIIDGYGGKDKVLEFEPRDSRGSWSVKVQEVGADGKPKPGQRPRWHSTQPDDRELRQVLGAEGWKESQKGSLYQVDIPDEHVANMLHWDRPLSEQPDVVKDALGELGMTFDHDPTGESIYREMSESLAPKAEDKGWTSFVNTVNDRLANDKAASERLNDLGVKGIKYLDEPSRPGKGPRAKAHVDTHNLVVFDDSIINLTHKDGSPVTAAERKEFLQGGDEATARGAYNPATGTISLLKSADLSTFLHESGHFFLDVMSKIASEPNAPEGIKADMATALKFMGHDGDAASFRALPLEGQRAGHEAFAQGFEKYLMEGKAPSFETRNLFSRFRSWLLNVYKSLGALKVEINPEIRGVFDRMMASDAAIKQAEQARQYMPMFDSPEKASMTPEQWQEYQALGAEASSKALDELSAKSIRDLAWSDNVRSAALRDLAKGAAEQRKAARREVEAQVDKQPVYAAQNFIRRGEIEPADRNNAKRKILEDASMSSTKLDLPALKAMYGDGPAAPWRYLRVGGEYGDVIKEGGIHPDLVADLFGFPSGDDLVRSLIAAEKRSDVVRGLTEQAMLEKHGEAATPEALAQAADDAVHNAIRTRFIATELKALNKALGPARELAKAAKDVAEATIAGKTIGSVNERQYTVAESRAGKEAMKRLAAGDVEGAAIAKRDQLLNNALSRAARDAQAAVDKGLAYLKRFNKDSIRKNVDVDIRDQIDQLLERFDLRQNPPEGPTKAQQSLERWVESQQAAGYSPAIPADLLDPAVRQHYQEMPIERFNGLVDSVKALEHIGKSRRELMIGAEKHDLDEYVNTRLVPKMAERGERFTKDELLERPQDRHTNEVAIVLDHFRSWMRAAAAQLKPQEFKRNQYDRHELLGPFGESLTDPVMNANYEKNRMLRELSGDFQKAATELGRKWQDSLRDGVHNGMLPDPDKSTPGDVQPLRMTRGRMIGIALHVGNESNFGKLTKGWGWDGADVWRFLHENMTASDWKAVQTVWDLYDKHWPEMEAMNRRLGNTMPDRIEPRAFPTKFGEMRGGYAAIKYDALRSRRGEKDAAMEAINPAKGLFGRDYYRPDTTTNGSMNSRVEGYNDRVDLDFHTIARTLQESIHDLAYRETLINANKVIEHPKFRSSFRAAYGNEAYTSLRQWIGQLANSNNMDQAVGALGKFFQYTRTGIVINAIAFRATTVLKHGGSAGVKSVGYFAGGGEKFLASRAASMATDYSNQIASARDKFGEIANRLAQQDRDWRATASTLFEPDKALEKAQRFGHAAVAWSDMMTAVPTAWAAYDRAITEGIPVSQGGTGEPMTESQAVNYANKIVREAHGSTAEASRSMLLNNNSEAIKIFTTLFGFMNNTYGQGLDGFDKLRTAGISNTPVLARTIAAIIVPAIIAGAISHLPQHDEGWAAWAGKAIAEEVASTVPFVRDAVAMVQGFDHAGVVGPENWLATMVKAGVDLAKGTGKQVRDIADAVGMGLHIPGLGQIGMSAQYIHDVQVGKENPHDNLEYAKGVITGHGPPKK